MNDLARVYSTLGEKQRALDYYDRALQFEREAGDRQGEIKTSMNLGRIYEDLGDKDTALELYSRALPLARKIEDRQLEMISLVHSASLIEDSGSKLEALALYDKALILAESLQDRKWKSVILNNSANVYFRLGLKERAFDLYTKALALGREIGDVQAQAIALVDLGEITVAMLSKEKARKYYEAALSVCRSAGDRRTEALTLFGMARLDRASGNAQTALSKMDEALRIVASLRTKIAISGLRASYSATVRRYFDFYIDTLMDLDRRDPAHKYAALALEACERSRARSLLDLLREGRVDIRQGVDATLLAKERSLNSQIDDYGQRFLLLAENNEKRDQAGAIRERLTEFERQHREVEDAIRQTSPRYAALLEPRTLTADEIRYETRDGHTLILEYALGEERSFLWAIDQEGIHSYELPRREEIDRLAREFYVQLTARIPTEKAGDELSAVVLGPAKALLGNKRLVVVPDGSLHFTPFSALRDPGLGDSSEVPLVVQHEITYIPSVSVLAVLQGEAEVRKPASKTLAILADPVFGASDSRLRRNTPRNPEVMPYGLKKPLDRSVASVGNSELPRLPFSRVEAESIASLLDKDQVTEALDFDANVTTAADPKLRQYRLIHFATHGILNSEDPSLSGLVLSLFDNLGKPREGFLKLTNIYNLRLSADLVVLSGCRTGLGKEISGEGLVGLTRGFMYAGAPRVVASLWNVDDSATAEFMKRFYRAMLLAKMAPAAALRFAQRSFLRQRAYTSPYYWAPFLISGPWR